VHRHKCSNKRITAENAEKSQHIDFNSDTTNERAGVACTAVKAGHSGKMKKHVLTPLT